MQPLSVLVADDESVIRDVLRLHLEGEGHRVRTAEDGAEALELFEKDPSDVVITDLKMPRIGGVEFTRRVKEAAPGTITIVLTGFGTLDSAVEVLHYGCDDFLLKPLPDMKLVSLSIERCLARRRALALATSSRRISQAKDNVLELTVKEFARRMDRLRKGVDKLEACASKCEGGEVSKIAETLKAQLVQLDAVLEDVKVVSQTLRDRSD